MIAAGADLNIQGKSGATALMKAIYYGYGHTETVKVLIAAGADLNIQDNNGKTALDIAKQKGNQDIINLLSTPSSAKKAF